MSILLKQQSDSLIINTGSTCVLGYSITYSVTGNKTYTNSADGTIETAGDSTVLNGPNPNYFYEITNISIVNNGTTPIPIQVKKNTDPLCSTGIVLSPGESLIYSGVWNYNNSDGSTIINLSGTINARIVNASGDNLVTTKLASEEQQVLGNDSLNTLIEKISTESKQNEIIEAIEGISVTVDLPQLTDGTQKTKIVDGSGNVVTVTGNKLDVNATISTAGLATEAKQDIGNTSLSSIDTKLSFQATAALQNTGNTSIANVDTNIGAKADSAASTDTGTFSVIAFIKRAMQNWTTLLAKTWPVTGTFFQATQPVSAATLPLPTNAATSALQTQPGVDIGDVTINNASGVSAVNIQDGGNSITVDNNGTFVVQSTLSAGSALIGKVGIDQTTPGTTNKVSLGSDVIHTIIDSGSTTVSGSVTANAGTNLNTSLLSTEATLASLLAKVIVSPATEAKQDTLQAAINLLAKLTDTQPVSVAIIPTHPVSQSGTWNIGSITTLPSLPAGSAVIGHVINDSGSTTAITGNVTMVQPTGSNLQIANNTYVTDQIPVYTEGQTSSLTQTSTGRLKVDLDRDAIRIQERIMLNIMEENMNNLNANNRGSNYGFELR